MRVVGQKQHGKAEVGYTLVEVFVVVVVMGVILTSGWALSNGYAAYLQKARDIERETDTSGLARNFERYYRTNASVSGPTYPSTTLVGSSLSTLLDDTDTDLTKAPGQTSSSVVLASTTATQFPSVNQYIYQPFTSAGTLCTAAPCVRFVFYYRTEYDNAVQTVESRRQQ